MEIVLVAHSVWQWDRASRARVGMPVQGRRHDESISTRRRYTRIVENAATQHLFRLGFMLKLQHDEERRRPVRSCQSAGARSTSRDYGLHRVGRSVSAVWYEQIREG